MIDIYVNGVIIYMQISQFSQDQFLICWFTGTNGRDGRDGGQGPKGIATIKPSYYDSTIIQGSGGQSRRKFTEPQMGEVNICNSIHTH